MCVSSHSQSCVVILANLTEFCAVRHFHCDFLEGKTDGLTKKHLAGPKQTYRDISK